MVKKYLWSNSMLSNAVLFRFNGIDINKLPAYRGIYVWYLRQVRDGIIYIGEARNIKRRLTEEIKYFNNGLWNYYNVQDGASFPTFLAEYLDSKEITDILKDDKIFIPWQPTSLFSLVANNWTDKINDLKIRIEILTLENVALIDNRKIEAFLINKVLERFKVSTGKNLYVKGAKKNQTQIGQIQGGPKTTWPHEVRIDFGNVDIPHYVKEILS
jgi:hypothetical protein